MKQPIQKVVQSREEYFIQFTDEELKELKMEKGQKYSWEIVDGAVKLTPYVKMEIDITDWDRTVLEMLIQESCERDVSVNEVINDLLEQAIEEYSV